MTSSSKLGDERANVQLQSCYQVTRSDISLPISAVQGAPALLVPGNELLRFQSKSKWICVTAAVQIEDASLRRGSRTEDGRFVR